ncbi:hypothetical protein [Spirillospora sp. NPDC047279]|uniref:hypothetical protein n=1 Tax=Spirillospora sp. NPDC047279 TaxID=3155478 RepID=UPI0033C8CAEB
MTTLTLTDGSTATARLDLTDLSPGHRQTQKITVTFAGSAPATIALYAPDAADTPLARRLRVSIFEHAGALMPFPVFQGTLADLTTHTSYDTGFGRWTGRTQRTVDYEVMAHLPAEAPAPTGTHAEITLTAEARPLGAPLEAAA